MAQQELDPLDILNAALTNEAQAYETEAVDRMDQAGTMVAQLADKHRQQEQRAEAPPTVRQIPAKPLNWVTSRNVEVKQDLETGETILYVNSVPSQRVTDPHKVFAASAAVQENRGAFDVDAAIAKAGTLGGEQLGEHVAKTMLEIDRAMRDRVKAIRDQAAHESGYASAVAALQREMQLDQQSPYAAIIGAGSAQTIRAQAIANQASIMRDRLVQGLVAEDSEIGRFQSAKEALLKVELKRAQREEVAARTAEAKREIREEKLEQVLSTVGPAAIANYRVLTGDKRPDTEIALTISKEQNKDKRLLYGADEETIWALVAHPSQEVKIGARKLILERQKATDPTIDPTATDSWLTKWIKQVQDNPKLLYSKLSKEARQELEGEEMRATGVKEKQEIQMRNFMKLLPGFIEQRFREVQTMDVRGWKSPIVNDPIMKSVVDEVAKTGTTNMAPLDSVVRTFATKVIKGPDGKELGFAEKSAMVEQMARQHYKGIPRNMLLTNDVLLGMEEQAVNAAKNALARAHMVKAMGEVSMGLAPNMWKVR